jgi:hypothetical protein
MLLHHGPKLRPFPKFPVPLFDDRIPQDLEEIALLPKL